MDVTFMEVQSEAQICCLQSTGVILLGITVENSVVTIF